MSKIIKYLGIIIPVVAVLGCAREEIDNSGNPFSLGTVKARVSEMPVTKVHLEEGYRVVWDLSDRIGVFSDMQDAEPFVKEGQKDSFSGNKVRGTRFYAFYPYSSSSFNPENRNIVSLTLGEGAAGTGNSPSLSVPMVAYYDEGEFAFRQTCGVLHFTISGTKRISSVKLYGNKGEAIAGPGKVNLDAGTPVFTLDPGGETSVSYAGYTMSAESPAEFWFVLPPMTFAEGISLEISYYEEEEVLKVVKTTAREIEVRRAIIKNFVAFDMDDLIPVEDESLTLERNALISFYDSTGGASWTNDDNWCSDEPVGSWYGVTTDSEGHVTGIDLDENNLAGPIPEDFYELTGLVSVSMEKNSLSGPISASIGRLGNLQYLDLCENNMSGNLPPELASTPVHYCYLYKNGFTGTIPDEFRQWDTWKNLWGWISYGTKLNTAGAMPDVPAFTVTLLDGETFSNDDFSSNRINVLFQGATWCGYTANLLPTVNKVYNYFKDKGLGLLAWFDDSRSGAAGIESFVSAKGIKYNVFKPSSDNTVAPGYSALYPLGAFPIITIFDSEGHMLWESLSGNYNNFQKFVEGYFGETVTDNPEPDPSLYASTDFSRDGKVTVVQTATEGVGIDLVFMGDAYSDRLLDNGAYETDINSAIEYFFSVEPYASFRNMFNIYIVEAVSLNEEYTSSSQTVFGGWFGSGTEVGGGGSKATASDAKAVEYAAKAVGAARADYATIVVIMNRDYYAGTCYMYVFGGTDYAAGYSVSYFPAYRTDPDIFAGLIRHEAGGHGFARLADEYSYERMGAITSDAVSTLQQWQNFGAYKNIDIESDPEEVLWAKYIGDDRYEGQGIGVYEGAYRYVSGVYRPTEQSIMNQNTGGFNAPSREAIYYRLHKMAYGDVWTYDHEAFVAWDAVNGTSASAPRRTNSVERSLPPLAPPVIRLVDRTASSPAEPEAGPVFFEETAKRR